MTSIVSAFANLTLALALSLTLSVVAVMSLVALRSTPQGTLEVSLSPRSPRGFKGEVQEVVVKLGSPRRRWGIPRLVSVAPPKGVEVTFERVGEGTYRLLFQTKFAGRFTGLTTRVEMPDAFALFSRVEESVNAGFVIDSLPTGLLVPMPVVGLSAVSLGDSPAGSRGQGQEFFSVELYDPSNDVRDIIWRRVASMPDDKLVVRLKEANIPEVLRVGFVETEQRGDGLPRWMDLVTEAMARVARSIMGAGVRVRIVSERGRSTSSFEVSSLARLADAVMEVWTTAAPETHREGSLGDSDIIITGTKELSNPTVALMVSRTPSVVISEERSEGTIGANAVVYTGKEDVGRIVQTVLTR